MIEYTDLTEDEQREYAADLILDHAKDVDRSSIYEMAAQLLGLENGKELSDKDALRVRKLIAKATVRVSWPDHEYVYGEFEDDDETSGESQ